MRFCVRPLSAALCLFLVVGQVGAGEDPEAGDAPRDVEQIEVFGRRFERYPAETALREATGVDTAELLSRAPGAAPAANGALTGQAQYRGMTGTRVNVAVDGMHINAGGPNSMDTPLHYAPRALLQSFELERGIAPVSSGMETIGGTLRARTKTSRFSDSEAFQVNGDLDITHRSMDRSLSGGALVSLSNQRHRFHAISLTEKGDDLRTPSGRIESSEFGRKNWGAGYGFRVGEQEFSVDYRQSSTDPSGTPALPLDIRFFDSQLIRAEYRGQGAGLDLSGRVFFTQIDHSMDNFKLRPVAPPPMATRFVTANSDGWGYEFQASRGVGRGTLKLGLDGHWANHKMDIFNPLNPAFFVVNFNDARRVRYGTFAEWTGDIGGGLELEAGLRFNHVKMDAGNVRTAPGLPAPARLLASQFNARDHEKTDGNVDWVLQLSRSFSRNLTVEAGVARKTRSPYYIERYAWLPIEATAGLADGNNHVGNLDIDPEVSHELELGLQWRDERFFFAPRAFVRYVDDYIQGTPVTDSMAVIGVSTVNGDPTPLRYTNVDATLFGGDLAWGAALTPQLSLEGTLTFVRGERRDVSDDLYRIAPLSGTVVLHYDLDESWSFGLEGEFAAEQENVSVTNGEQESSGYGLLHATARWQVTSQAAVLLRLENLLDQSYRRHLAGFNRVVGDEDTAFGERFLGAGRGISIGLQYTTR